MDEGAFQGMLVQLTVLSPAQLVRLDAAVRVRMAAAGGSMDGGPAASSAARASPPDTGRPLEAPSIEAIEARFALAPQCPHCQSNAITRWGSANGLRRYRCKPCGVTFNALTGTSLARLHKRELWGAHAQALVDGISLRRVAKRLDIDLTTSFRWRHRFLKAPRSVKSQCLDGTVEADETYFLHSEKGSPSLQRPPRERGGKADKPGLSEQQVPVLIARDRSAATTDQVLPDRTASSIAAVLEPVVAKSAILVSDAAKAYGAFAREARLVHVPLNLSAGERRWGVYHIQNVNGYASRLKSWMRRFNGVATKHLPSYLGWHRLNEREGDTLCARSVLAAAWG